MLFADGKALQLAIVRIARLKSDRVCHEFHDFVISIRKAVGFGSFTYADIGVSELELLELALKHAGLKLCLGVNTFTDLCILNRYKCELTRVKFAL